MMRRRTRTNRRCVQQGLLNVTRLPSSGDGYLNATGDFHSFRTCVEDQVT